MLLNYNHELIEIEVIRSKRKNLCISINEDGKVIAKIPAYVSEPTLKELIDQKAAWIYEKREAVKQRQIKKVKRQYVNGATLMYMGKEVPMELIFAKQSNVELFLDEETGDSKFVIHAPNTEVESMQKLLKKWYKKQSMEYLTQKVATYAQNMKVTYGSISIKSRKKQWGTCDTQGNLTFSWRLIMAREDVIDYVIVHELCHRKHMDHSKQFWNAVEQVLPDYKKREQWLQDNNLNMII